LQELREKDEAILQFQIELEQLVGALQEFEHG
jgi:hypothetical protein